MYDANEVGWVADITRYRAKAQGGDTAQVFGERRTTYAELDAYANRVAQGLIAEGCKPDSRIGYIGKSSDLYFEVLYGAFKAKAVMVGVNWRLAAPEIAYVLNDSRTEILFVGAEYYDVVEKVLPECPNIRKVVALDGGRSDWISFEIGRAHV